jgi:hypothetical protein
MRFACINYLEAIVDKVPHAMHYLSTATGPAAPFEEPPRETYASRSRKRPFARLGSTFLQSARDMFANSDGGRMRRPAPRWLDRGDEGPNIRARYSHRFGI